MKIKNKLAVAICLIFVSQTLMSVSTNLTVVWPFETLDYSVPAQVINAGKSNDQQIKDGFINVTWYGADPSGVSDSTTAFQNAVNDSREYRYTLYIPTGTYLISDTIDCMQKVYRHPYNSNWMIGANKPIVIMGQYREDGKKPVLKLKTNSSGFNDTNNLKPLMQIWAQTINISPTNVPSTSITTEQANISFNNKLINVMIDINSAGSSGACGIRNASAQGTSIEDIIVIASNGFAGFYNMPGPSGGYYNIAVYGGKYGIYAKYAERSTIAGAVFEYQTEAAIYEMCMGYCLIGFRIVTLSGNAVKCPYNYGWKDSGPILVDGSITMANGGRAIDNLQGFTTYVKNVYFYNAGEIIKSGIDPIVSGIINKWCKIEEYSYAQKDNENDTNHGPATNCSDGIIGDNTLCKIIDNCLVPPADLVSRHIWDETSFPHYGMKSIINVQKDLGAKGDGASDDTAALQNAFTNYRYVFIPRGKYKIRNQLILGKNTRVIGAGSVYSLICPDTNYWKPSEYIPLIATEDSAAGDAALAYIGIQLPSQFTNIIRFGAIDWRVGRNSIIRSIKYSAIDWTAIDATNYFIIYRVTGSGGGKFFGIEAGMLRHSYHPDHRGFLAENTREPLNLYSLNVERNQGDYQAEFNNCKNIQVYFSKSENNRPFLMITNCKNISVFGYGGNGCPWTNRACIEVFNSDHITLGGIVPFCPTSPYDVLYPLDPGAGYKIDPLMDYSVTENYFGNINQLVKKVPAGILKRGNSVTSTPNVLPLLSDNFSMVIPGYILETGISLSDGKLICTDTSATRNVKWGDPDMSCIKTECTIKVDTFGTTTGWKTIWLSLTSENSSYISCYVDQGNKKFNIVAKTNNIIIASASATLLSDFDLYSEHRYFLSFDGETATAYLDGANKLAISIAYPLQQAKLIEAKPQISFINTSGKLDNFRVSSIFGYDAYETFNDGNADDFYVYGNYVSNNMFIINGNSIYQDDSLVLGNKYRISYESILNTTDANWNVPRLYVKYNDLGNYIRVRLNADGYVSMSKCIAGGGETTIGSPVDVLNLCNFYTNQRSAFGRNVITAEINGSQVTIFINGKTLPGLVFSDSSITDPVFNNCTFGFFGLKSTTCNMGIDNVAVETLH